MYLLNMDVEPAFVDRLDQGKCLGTVPAATEKGSAPKYLQMNGCLQNHTEMFEFEIGFSIAPATASVSYLEHQTENSFGTYTR